MPENKRKRKTTRKKNKKNSGIPSPKKSEQPHKPLILAKKLKDYIFVLLELLIQRTSTVKQMETLTDPKLNLALRQ